MVKNHENFLKKKKMLVGIKNNSVIFSQRPEHCFCHVEIVVCKFVFKLKTNLQIVKPKDETEFEIVKS